MLRKIKRASLIVVISSSAIFLSANFINSVEVKSDQTSVSNDPIWPSSIQPTQNV